jgi:23S rRNA pseudouridine1911/1915/1917 synthase
MLLKDCLGELVIAEDQHLAFVAKPAGVHSVVNQLHLEHPSVAQQLISIFPSLADVSPRFEDGGLVNRLDFETSGCLVVAKSRVVWELIHKRFTEGSVIKRYLAILKGKVPDELVIESYLGHRRKNARKVKSFESRPRYGSPSPARTQFFHVRYFPADDYSLVSATTHQGRRHQIRVHAAALGFPLVGDRLYGDDSFGVPNVLKQLGNGDFFFYTVTSLRYPTYSGSHTASKPYHPIGVGLYIYMYEKTND